MKLIIQMLCYNEEETLPFAVKDLPREAKGFDKVEWLLLDDGSTDNSVKVAKNLGFDYIIQNKNNLGVAKSFITAIESCIELGADVIVNTDADNQYNAKDIPRLLEPILQREADIVIGTRPIMKIEYFSPFKKTMQLLGSFVIRKLSGTNITDVTSGFKAISREAALQLNIFGEYAHCVETAMLIGLKKIKTKSVPIAVNEKLRESRLIKSNIYYILNGAFTALKAIIIYRPFIFFQTLGWLLLLASSLILLKISLINHNNSIFHIPALILFFLGGQSILISFLSCNLAANKKLLESIQFKIRNNSNIQSVNNKSNIKYLKPYKHKKTFISFIAKPNFHTGPTKPIK